MLTEEELADLNVKIDEATSQKEKLAHDEEHFRDVCAWFENLHGIESHLETAKNQLKIAEREQAEFEPNREKLERALRAQEVETSYAEYNSVRINFADMESQLETNKAKLPEAESNLENVAKENGEKQADFEKCKADYTANESIWEQVSSMDGDIRNARTQLKNLEIDAAKATAETSSIQSNIDEAGKKISENELSLEKVEMYIAVNQKDESIDGLLSLLKSQIAEWKTENASIVETLKVFGLS